MIKGSVKKDKFNFIASVNDDRLDDIESIVRSLKELGCNIDNVLKFSGIITGTTASEMSLTELKIDGIKNVEPERIVKTIAKPVPKNKI
jgi:hypothetical protein